MQLEIKRVVGEIATYYHESTRETSSFPFSWFMWVVHLLTFLWHSLFVSSLMVLSMDLLLDFCVALSLSVVSHSKKRESPNTHQNSEHVKAAIK